MSIFCPFREEKRANSRNHNYMTKKIFHPPKKSFIHQKNLSSTKKIFHPPKQIFYPLKKTSIHQLLDAIKSVNNLCKGAFARLEISLNSNNYYYFLIFCFQLCGRTKCYRQRIVVGLSAQRSLLEDVSENLPQNMNLIWFKMSSGI